MKSLMYHSLAFLYFAEFAYCSNTSIRAGISCFVVLDRILFIRLVHQNNTLPVSSNSKSSWDFKKLDTSESILLLLIVDL